MNTGRRASGDDDAIVTHRRVTCLSVGGRVEGENGSGRVLLSTRERAGYIALIAEAFDFYNSHS
jgi:hypothetical protein